MSADKDARIAELERECIKAKDYMVSLSETVTQLSNEKAELERELAEQQAAISKVLAVHIGDELEFKLYNSNPVIWKSYLIRVLSELNNLLAKAKEEGRKEALPQKGRMKCFLI